MATYVPALNTAEVVLNGFWGGQNVANVLAFQYDVPLSPAELNSLAAQVVTSWIAYIKPITAIGYVLNSVKATDLTTSSSPSVTYFPDPAPAGSLNTASVANNVSLVISFYTALRGRSFRGRLYMAGLANTAMTTSVEVSVATATAYTTAWTNFIGQIETTRDCDHVVVSRYSNGVARAAAVMTLIADYAAEIYLDSRRSRLENRGD